MAGKPGMRSDKPTVPARPRDFAALDLRFKLPRWIRDRRAEIRTHLGGVPSVLQEALVSRFVYVEMISVNLETQLAAGQEIDVQTYLSLVDRLHSLSRTLGLRRTARDVPSLADLKRAAEKPA